ncbi:D-methionine transport system ATP-binding protein [Pseudonocardia hierapolitana]|uniref:D-methionine transport system ATP-binding protein n=1 Tax=Pseudonocardia hierapolitana TaxID=1128676 RepID=A0A561T0R9_9PSEU|nr:methionine ABC transporter ATP-binding protein [Pseudonocardia hierapolitana]TWF80687.1 D-methionine transport system ATP-binding protein [Pseudonocardia hierapolitana]
MAPLISFRGVSKVFPSGRGQEVRAVDGVDLDVEDGEITGVIGHSGAGKSTLVRMINALELPTEGTVTVGSRVTGELGERGLRELRGEVGMIFQQFNLFSSRTVAGNVGYPLRIAGWSRERRRERVAELLEFVGIAEKARQFPSQLSGGQKQRVGIARALATSPRILLADEATSALDPETTKDVLALLKRINRELGTTIVVITHEMDVVSSICDTVAVMEQGRVIERGPVLFSDPREPATRRFVHSVLHDRPSEETLVRLREHFPGRIVTVGIRDDPAVRTAVSEVIAGHDVRSTIIYGGIRELADKPFGSITLELAGADPAIDALIAELRTHTHVEELAQVVRS